MSSVTVNCILYKHKKWNRAKALIIDLEMGLCGAIFMIIVKY